MESNWGGSVITNFKNSHRVQHTMVRPGTSLGRESDGGPGGPQPRLDGGGAGEGSSPFRVSVDLAHLSLGGGKPLG